MNAITVLLALASLAIVAGEVVRYMMTIPKGTVPKNPVRSILTLTVGVVVALLALVLGPTGTVSSAIAVYVPATLAIMIGGFFLYIFSQRKIPLDTLRIREGEPWIPFEARRWDGELFSTADLAGKRVLLKFFRGQWCPYCAAELKRFEQMRSKLEQYGIAIVALSKDSVEDAARHRRRDGLTFPLLSDPDLSVIRTYGVEHHKALEISTGAFTMLGMQVALVPEFKSMAIPTTVLVDERGVVRWIDQGDDYRLRSDIERVLGAIRNVFDPPAEQTNAR